MAARHRIVIAGAGFGGLAAAKRLRKLPVDVMLIDRHNYYLFQPLLYQVASGLLNPSEIAYPIRSILRRARNVEVRMAEVTGIDPAARTVTTSTGTLEYDTLIIATGSVSNHYNIAGLEHSSFGLNDLGQALQLRAQVLSAFERADATSDDAERRRLLSFAVVGGGPTGVEYSGALAELIRHVLPKDFPRIDFTQVSVTLVEGTDQVLGTFAPRLGRKAAASLQRKGVRLLFGHSVRDVTDGEIVLDSGERKLAGTVVWTAGVRATPIAAWLGTPAGSMGRIPVTESLHLAERPEIFVVGDLAQLRERDVLLPMLAPVAMQQGRHVARVIEARLKQKPEPSFHYLNKGNMATIGRGSAVAEVWRIRVNGFLGWLMWLGLHLLYIVGFRSRVVVLITWAWNFFFYDRPVRLIIDYPGATAAGMGTRNEETPT